MLIPIKIIGVIGGVRGAKRLLYFRCPDCGTLYEHACSAIPNPYISDCDRAANHETKAPIQFVLNWASTPLGGTVTVNQRDILVTDAFCFLFNGCLEINFQSHDVEGRCSHFSFGDAIDFSELTGQSISIADCDSATYSDLLFKPSFSFDHSHYSISSLHVNNIRYLNDSDLLSLTFSFETQHDESPLTISAMSQLTALCEPVKRSDVLHRLSQIQFDLPRRICRYLAFQRSPKARPTQMLFLCLVSLTIEAEEIIRSAGSSRNGFGTPSPGFICVFRWRAVQ